MVPRLRELFRKAEADVTSNSWTKIHQTWHPLFSPPLQSKYVQVQTLLKLHAALRRDSLDYRLHLEGGASESELGRSGDHQLEAVCSFLELVGHIYCTELGQKLKTMFQQTLFPIITRDPLCH